MILSGKKVTFIFKTTAGPKGNAAYDQAGWSNLKLRKKLEVTLIDLGTPEARQYMQDGWSLDDKIARWHYISMGDGEQIYTRFFYS